MSNNNPSCHIALYQPDIAGNTGTILRLAACIGAAVHIIEPAGFDLSDRNLKRAGMDYLEMASLTRHLDWDAFSLWRKEQQMRLVLLTTKTDVSYSLGVLIQHKRQIITHDLDNIEPFEHFGVIEFKQATPRAVMITGRTDLKIIGL